MIYRHRVILSIFITICVLFCTGTRSLGKGFKWGKVNYKGKEYLTLKSVKSFYEFKTIRYGKKITLENKLVKMEFQAGSQQCRMNRLLFILSDPIIHQNGKYLLSRTDLMNLVDPVLRPKHIQRARAVKTIVIDAGHGGHDSGSPGIYQNEKVYTLKVARLVKGMLLKKGYRVVMTRDSDVFISLANRVRIANKHPDAIFISIHFNSGNSRAHGIETFTISPLGVPHLGRGVRPRDFQAVPGNTMGSASIALATAAHSRAFLYLNNAKSGNNFKMFDRGIKRARFNVLTGIKIPAILLEGGFVTNRTEARKINSPAYQKKLAASLVDAIKSYSNSVDKTKNKKAQRK